MGKAAARDGVVLRETVLCEALLCEAAAREKLCDQKCEEEEGGR